MESISKLEVREEERKLLREIYLSGRKWTISEVANFLNFSYETTRRKLEIWMIKGWLKRFLVKNDRFTKSYYDINEENLNL